MTSDSVNVTRSPSIATLYTADPLNLTCVTKVHQAVDVPVVVTHQWAGPGGVVSSSSDVSVSGVTGSGHTYTSMVMFNLLSSQVGIYTCSSTVSPVGSPVFILSSGVEQTSSTSFNAGMHICLHYDGFNPHCIAIRVNIEIDYTSPDDYPHYSPPNYRTASSVTMRCVTSGTTGSVSYRWSSTCGSSCFASSSSSQNISKNCLIARDAGVHTCSVTDGVGNSGTNATTMRIVGKLFPFRDWSCKITIYFAFYSCRCWYICILGYK